MEYFKNFVLIPHKSEIDQQNMSSTVTENNLCFATRINSFARHLLNYSDYRANTVNVVYDKYRNTNVMFFQDDVAPLRVQ